MDKRQRKQIKKRIEGIRKEIEKHKEKIRSFSVSKDTTKDYWEKEIGRMEREVRELEARDD